MPCIQLQKIAKYEIYITFEGLCGNLIFAAHIRCPLLNLAEPDLFNLAFLLGTLWQPGVLLTEYQPEKLTPKDI